MLKTMCIQRKIERLLASFMTAFVLHSPVIPRRLTTELPGVLDVQSLPVELHRVATNDGADGNGKTGGSRCEFLENW